jgi:succinate dehydrogenase/fumarate reductase cytochrome b subunit
MCCAIAVLFAIGPRAAILVWWLFEPLRWSAAFDTFVWPFLGFLIAPWTTLMYVAVFPGGINGFDYLFLGLGILFDLFSWFGGGYSNRGRMRSY